MSRPTHSGATRRNLIPVLLVAALVVLVANGPSCGIGNNPRRAEYIESSVDISHRPRLNEPFTATGTFTRIRENPSGDPLAADLWLGVASGVYAAGGVYLEGEDRWSGQLAVGEEKVLTATFAVVAEGNYKVIAGANSEDLEESGAISFYSSSDSAGPFRFIEDDPPPLNVGDPPVFSAPNMLVRETSLALNQSSSPRVELITSEDDLSRLQEMGLLPQELTHWYWPLKSRSLADFSTRFFVVVYGPLQDTPGCGLSLETNGFVDWNDGNVRIPLTLTCVPDGVPRAEAPASSMAVLAFGRQAMLIGPPDEPFVDVVNGASIEFTVNGQWVGQIKPEISSAE